MADIPSESQSATPKPTSWWATLPGVLTALTGLIAAITALLLVFHPKGELVKNAETNPSASTMLSSSACGASAVSPGESLGTVAKRLDCFSKERNDLAAEVDASRKESQIWAETYEASYPQKSFPVDTCKTRAISLLVGGEYKGKIANQTRDSISFTIKGGGFVLVKCHTEHGGLLTMATGDFGYTVDAAGSLAGVLFSQP